MLFRSTLANVSITAGTGLIIDADGLVNNANDSNLDIVASGLRLVAGVDIGATINHLDTTVGTLTARASSGGIYVSETDGLVIGDVSVTIQRVGSNAGLTLTVDATQSDVRTTAGNGNIVLTAGGSVVLNDGTAATDDVSVSANGSGNVLIRALAGDVIANADILSGSGHLTVLAANAVLFTGTADLASTGTLDVEAGTGSITQSTTSVFSSASDIRLLAAQDVTIGLVTTLANVSITAIAGSIIDADALVNNANDTNLDIVATGLRANAGVGIGANINHLDTAVGTLTARATTGGIYVKETDGLIVGDVSVTIQRVGSDAATTSTTDAVQSDVRTVAGNGNIVLTAGGSIVLNDGTATADDVAIDANGSGNVLVLALGGDLIASADIVSGNGAVSVLAAGALSLTGSADLRTAGSIDIEAAAIAQSVASVIFSTSDVRLLAATTVTVGAISTTGNVSITALTDSILDADSLVNGANDGASDIVANGLRLNAGAGIGDSVNHLDTTVATLTARATAGGIYVNDTDSLTVGDVGVTVQRVGSNAATTATIDALQSDVITTAGNGNIVLAAGGSIVLNDGTANTNDAAVLANGSGNILVLALGGNVIANADVAALTGHLTVLALGSVAFTGTADLSTSGAGTINVEASTGSITQSTASVFSTNSDIRLLAAQDVTVGLITTTGNVGITAVNGSILDGDALIGNANDTAIDIYAVGLRLNAGNGIGDSVNHLDTAVGTLTARANAGGVYVKETDGLVIGDVSVTIQRVGGNAATTATIDALQSDVRTIAGNGNIVLTTGGSLVLNDGTATADDISVAANGSGNVLVLALGGDVIANADIESGAGALTVQVAGAVAFTGTADLRTSGSIDVEAAAIVQSATSLFTSISDIRLLAANNVTVGNIATAGNVAITAINGSIVDADGLLNGSNDSNIDITANGLRLNAGNGIGDTVNHLDVTVNTLTARATSGGIYLKESDNLVIADVGVTVQRVGSTAATTATTDAVQSDVRTTAGNGNIVITTGGSIVLTDGAAPGDDTALSANGSGNILVLALGGDVIANADIASATGHLTVLAANTVAFNGTADLRSAGTLDVEAAAGNIAQATGSQFVSTGDIRLSAAQSVTVGTIATAGNVSITAINGAIIDGDALANTLNDALVDITANGLRLNAGVGIGAAVNHLETTVNVLSARANSGIYLNETDGLTVGDVATTVQRVGSNAATTAIAGGLQSDLITTSGNGNIVLTTTAGNLVLQDGATPANDGAIAANGAGNILLSATAGSVIANADIVSGTGNISVLAANAITLAGTANVRTTGAGTVDLNAATGSITQSAGSLISATSDIQLAAAGNITIGGVATAGSVSVTAGGSIIDGGDRYTNVVAAGLRLTAGNAVGNASDTLDTTVGTLSARAGNGGVFVQDSDGLAIGNVGSAINRVNQAGATSLVIDSAVSDVRTTANGNIVLGTTTGDLVLNDGTAPADGLAINANGSGSILVHATVGNVVANAGITSGTGNVSVLGGGSVLFNASAGITTAGAGTVDVEALTGNVTQAASSLFSAVGDIRVSAAGNVTVGGITTAGNVGLTATAGSIIDGGDTYVNVTASGLRLVAGVGVGSASDLFDTRVDTVAARATSGGIFLNELDGVTVGDVAVTVQKAGAASVTIDPAIGDLRTTAGNGGIVLKAGGDVLLTAGAGAADGAISANGSGGVRIETTGTGKITAAAGADIASGTGNIVLNGAGDVLAGKVATQGQANVSSQLGTAFITQPVDAQGKDVELVGNVIDIGAPIASAGGTLTIRPADPARDIVVGDASLATAYPDALYVGNGAIGALVPGFQAITIGSGAADEIIRVSGVTNPVKFADPLVLNATGAGSQVVLQGTVSAGALTVLGSGAGTTASAATLQVQGAVDVNDRFLVDGAVQVAAGLGGKPGDITFRGAVDAVAGGAADSLVLSGQGGSVTFGGTIGAGTALNTLQVSDAVNVVFDKSVHVTGDVVIQATGTVQFNDLLTLDGGTLRIVGASSVMLGTVQLGNGGDLVISANMLSLLGNVTSSGDANLTLFAATPNGNIVIGGSGAAGSLVITGDTLSHLQGFSTVDIGSAVNGQATPASGSATVDLSALAKLSAGQVNVHGSQVALQGVGQLTGVTGGISIDSAGVLSMGGTTSLTTNGASITMHAQDNLTLGSLNTGATGTVVLVSNSGIISDVGNGTAPNVTTGTLVMRGYGPVWQNGQSAVAAIEVAASRIDVDAPGGLVLRDSGANGETVFNLYQGTQVHRQLVALGTPERVTSPLQPDLGGMNGVTASIAADGLSSAVSARSFAAFSSPSLSALLPTSEATRAYLSQLYGSTVQVDLADMDAEDELGLLGPVAAEQLEQAYLLGSLSSQPTAAGVGSVGTDQFEYWDETLVL